MTITEGRSEERRGIRRWVMWLSLAIPVAAVIIYLLIWHGPDLIARHDIGNVTGPLRALRLQQARDAARGRLLTLGAGLFAAGALLFTGRNYRLARETLKAQRDTLDLTAQGQVTDRYTKAIEQLGSDKLDVRIGSLYALERIARDSPADHSTVMEVLAAFTREHSHEPWPPPAPGTPGGSAPGRRTRPDVEAAMTIIGRRNARNDKLPIDISHAELIWVYLPGTNLERLDLYRADLPRAILRGARLADASLCQANLGGADLTGADLTGANLAGANLTDANLDGANLTGADLAGAKLSPHAVPPPGWAQDPSTGLLRRTP